MKDWTKGTPMTDYKLIQARETDHDEARVYVEYGGNKIEIVVLSEGIVLNVLDESGEDIAGSAWETWDDVLDRTEPLRWNR